MASGNEYNLVEKPALKVLNKLGYEIIDKEEEVFTGLRDDLREILLETRLKKFIKSNNPWINANNLQRAVNKLKKIRATDTMQINKIVHKRLVQHISVLQDRGRGNRNQTVKYIDYANPENNDFLAISQFKVASSGENIVPDIVIFINGIPLGVIECKSPTIADPGHKAIDQLMRYQNLRKDGRTEGVDKLFWYNQFTVATWSEQAVSATYGASADNYKAWRTPTYPDTEETIKAALDKEKLSPQDILLYSLFKKERLLELIRYFTVFEDTGQGTNKAVARYQQYQAVQKTMDEIKQRDELEKDGGVIWHTQGSGKSFTMLFLGLKLKQELPNPTILIVTDRVTLDDQIHATFEQAGFPNPVQADGVYDLQQKLQGAAGQTITTLIQKFQDEDMTEDYPVLSRDKDIYVMVDEAHRTQYKLLANNMRTALPNAFYIGFSGTPIEKRERHTRKTFGRYIDKYTIDQSIYDGTTLPIFYQNRRSKIRLEGGSLDRIFDRVMQDKTEEEKEEVKRRYAREQDIAGSTARIEVNVLDILQHFEEKISPPFKAMIVTIGRKEAVEYQKKMEEYNAPESAVIITGDHNDSEDLKKYTPSKEEEKILKKRFKDPQDKLKFVIVCDKLLTGFNVPVAQVMYLDKPLQGHSLLQAIARVNRLYKDKNYGLIIDYYGISDKLQEAMHQFSQQDVQRAMIELTDDKEVIARLESLHRKLKSFFPDQSIDDLEICVEGLEQEQDRLEFNKSFKTFAKLMDILLPEPEANPFKKDLKRFGEIYQMAKNRYRDSSMDLAGCGQKVRETIREHVTATDIEVVNLEPISIMDRGKFEEELGKLKSDKAKASEMQHALLYEISLRNDDDPVYYKTLQEKVETLIERYNQKRIAEEEIIKELQGVIQDIRAREAKAREKGFADEVGLSIYHTLEASLGLEEEALVEVSKKIMGKIKSKRVVGWKNKVGVQKEMRKELKLTLLEWIEDEDIENKLNHIVNNLIKLSRRHW